ncbi:MAG: TetR/AcrR family transcriptional regulator [Methylococcales bacterium]
MQTKYQEMNRQADKAKSQKFLDREHCLVTLALKIMHKDGNSSLSMETLTAQSDYSKGTIYNHFSCKEDLLSAISIQSMVQLKDLFSRAILFKGNTRERLIAIQFAYLVHAQLNPEQFMCILTCKTTAVTEKASHQRQQICVNKENEILDLFNALVKEAEINHELNINQPNGLQLVTFCNWSVSFGSLALLMHIEDSQVTNTLDLQEAFLHNICMMLDGVGWKPHSSQWDYNKTINRIKSEIFAPEIKLLSTM